jgi:hypothetical protein
MARNKHYVYIIPDYKWNDGSIGKIGVTQNPDRRAKEYKLESLTILEEHTNAKVASKREIELQKQYGFKVDTREYWKTLKMQKKSQTPESQIKRTIKMKGKSMHLCHTPEAIKKRVAKTNWEQARKKAAMNTDYKAIMAKREIDYNKRKKPINQYDLEGNFIKQWDSSQSAGKSLGKANGSDITQCCKGKKKIAFNYIWKYAN